VSTTFTPSEVSSLWAPTGDPTRVATTTLSPSHGPSISLAPVDGELLLAVSGHRCLLSDMKETRPPPEPSPPHPSPLDLETVLACVQPEDRPAFAVRFIEDSVSDSTPRQHGCPTPTASCLIFPLALPVVPPPSACRALVEYAILLDKARPTTVDYFPQGSIMDPGLMIRAASPTTPFEFPFDMPSDEPHACFEDYVPNRGSMDSVTRVVGLLRMFGLKGDETLYAKTMRAATPIDSVDILSLMDGGANICITGVLSLLVDVVSIPPLPISVATKSGSLSLDVCCTKQGLIPLTLIDGAVYYQPCCYCKNATETIISPEAILAANDTLVHWTQEQEGHKGDASGCIRFTSDSGLYSISLALEFPWL
jgi:hypothetical protein